MIRGRQKDFFIAEEKQLRNLETIYQEKKACGPVKKKQPEVQFCTEGQCVLWSGRTGNVQ